MTAAPAGGGLAEVLALLDRAWRGKWSVHDAGANDGGAHEYEVIAAGDGTSNFPQATTGVFYADPHDATAACAAVNYLRSHGKAIAELIEAATELRQRQRDYLADPKGQRNEAKGRLVGIAADRLDAALAKVASNGATK